MYIYLIYFIDNVFKIIILLENLEIVMRVIIKYFFMIFFFILFLMCKIYICNIRDEILRFIVFLIV